MARDDEDEDDRPVKKKAKVVKQVEDDEDDDDDRPVKQKGKPVRRVDDDDEDDDDEDDRPRKKKKKGGGIIPKNAKALTAYYCGVFSFIPVLGLLVGPVAMVMGLLGILQAKNNPEGGGTIHSIVGILLALVGMPVGSFAGFMLYTVYFA